MGNTIGGGRKKAKIMKIDGQTFKLKTPVKAADVVKPYPGHVLLDSENVKRFGIRAKPLDPQQDLKPKKIYFLVELPKFPDDKQEGKQVTRRVRSGITMTAKDRLECLMLSRRAVSDLSIVRSSGDGGSSGVPEMKSARSESMRVKVRVPRAQMMKLVEESIDEAEVAEKIVNLYMADAGEVNGGAHRKTASMTTGWNGGGTEKVKAEKVKAREKHVSFVQKDNEGEIRLLETFQ